MAPVELQVPEAGSYISAVEIAVVPLYPPATSTLPLGSSVAVWLTRGEAMEPVATQAGAQAGRPVTVKSWAAVRPKALVTVAVMRGGVRVEPQAGAVQVMRLWDAPGAGVPRAPMLDVQEKVSAEPSGSLALTSKVSCWPAVAVSEELKAAVM